MRMFNSSWVMWVSFVPALVLTLIPLPAFLGYARPQWVFLFMIFWLLNVPEKAGLVTAWIVGLLMDILTGTLLGQHALAMLLGSFTGLWLQKRMCRAGMMEQMLLLVPMILVFQMVYLWVGTALGRNSPSFAYLVPVVTSMVFWPVISFLLDKLCEIYVVKKT